MERRYIDGHVDSLRHPRWHCILERGKGRPAFMSGIEFGIEFVFGCAIGLALLYAPVRCWLRWRPVLIQLAVFGVIAAGIAMYLMATGSEPMDASILGGILAAFCYAIWWLGRDLWRDFRAAKTENHTEDGTTGAPSSRSPFQR